MGATRKDKERYKPSAIRAAKDLGYGDEVVRKIRAAKTDDEIERIMVSARHKKFGD